MEDTLFSTIAAWIVWPCIACLSLYWYLIKDHGYWKKRGVPFVPPLPIFGSIFKTFSKPGHVNEVERYKKYGRIYGHFEGSRPVINVADPDLVRNILVKDFQYFTNRRSIATGDPIGDKMVNVVEGEDWKRLRTIISPTFTTGKIKRMLNIFIECATTLCQNFSETTKDGKPINAKSLFGAFTMDVIASSAFSTKIDTHKDPDNDFVQAAKMVFTRGVSWRAIGLFLFPNLMRFFRVPIFQPTGTKFFKEVTLQIIKERTRTGKTRNDFLQLLMDTAKEVSNEEANEAQKSERETIMSNYGTEENNDIFKKYLKNRTLTHDEMVAQCVIFFLAGYETTASTLAFVSHNLCLYPEAQEKLIQEIDEAVKEAGGKITYEAIQSMRYLDNVISETLRMYPPAPRLERKAESDYKLGDTGITIPKDMIIGIPNYAMQRDPENFPDPDKFDPDRFSIEEKSNRSPYTYLPFGAGPRNCVGMRFALTEMKVCLAYVLSHFRIKRCAETKVPLDFYVGVGLLQPKEVMVMMEPRNDSVLKL